MTIKNKRKNKQKRKYYTGLTEKMLREFMKELEYNGNYGEEHVIHCGLDNAEKLNQMINDYKE